MKKFMTLILALSVGLPLLAGAASPFPVKVTQPDGSIFFAKIRGDEHQRWVQTLEGYTIIKNEHSQAWEYARVNKRGGIMPSGHMVRADIKAPDFARKDIRPVRDHEDEHRTIKNLELMSSQWNPTLISGTRNLLFIAVSFNDRALVTTQSEWDTAIFDETPNTKTVANFYKDNSRGLLQPARVTNTQTSTGIIEVSINRNHPNTGHSNQTTTQKYNIETAWINDALAAASSHVNFNALDTNNDNDLTLDEAVVYFIVAGYDASGSTKEPNVWAHKWGAWTPGDVMAGNVQVNRWAINGELYDTGDRHAIGVITHELGHLMCYLPDLYDINGQNAGMGMFSLMAGGSWGTANTDTLAGQTPVNMDAWSRYVIGWANPRTPSSGSVSFGLPLDSADSPVLFYDAQQNNDEYWLIENRHPTGWDLGAQSAMEDSLTTLTEGSNDIPANPMTYTPLGNVTGTAVSCGFGEVGDFPGSVNGQIALISRGNISFVDKVINAQAAGANAVIVYNNTTGELNGTLGAPGNYIPAIGIQQADGPGLAGKTVTVNIGQTSWNGGLLIQHVDVGVGTVSGNNINSSANAHQGVTVEEAQVGDGSLVVAGGGNGSAHHLFHTGTSSSFDEFSTPNSNYYDGSASGFGISNISAAGASMTATIGSGGPANTAPTASFSYNASLLSVNFTDGSSDSDGTVTGWSWSFGDGNNSTSQNPSHNYASAGSYTVQLTVTDNDGAQDTTSQVVTVTSGGGGSWVTIDSNNFESGWGIWNDGGSDVRRNSRDSAYAHQGTFCVRLRDNSGVASAMTTDVVNLGSYSEARIEFWMYIRSFEGSENVFVEHNSGSGWTVVADLVNGVDFSNNTFVNVSETVSGVTANSQFRIRCDASGNNDQAYVDEVVISAR